MKRSELTNCKRNMNSKDGEKGYEAQQAFMCMRSGVGFGGFAQLKVRERWEEEFGNTKKGNVKYSLYPIQNKPTAAIGFKVLTKMAQRVKWPKAERLYF